MNAPVLNPKVDEIVKKALTELSIHEAIIKGFVSEINAPQNGEYTYFIINLPAADAYSLPPVVQVSQSNKERPFAQKNEEVVLHCRLGGYPRKNSGVTYYSNTYTLISRLY